jgi:L-ascorbate metabolism protein UlaG (beta-lactamase superfamily)
MMPASAMARALSWGVPRNQITTLKAGQCLSFQDIAVSAVAARHNAGVEGWEVHDGVCLILEIEGIKIFFSGDTEYDTSLRKLGQWVLVAFPVHQWSRRKYECSEAALLGWQLGAQTLVPMHITCGRTMLLAMRPRSTAASAGYLFEVRGQGRVIIGSQPEIVFAQ